MARIRTIKPEMAKHEGLYDAEIETGLPIRFAFAMLFTVCDREGRFKWRPRTLKADVLPHDDVDFSRVLHALTTRGFLVRYACGTEEYGCIPTFTKHQVINNRETESILPSPEDSNCKLIEIIDEFDACPTRDSHVDDACPTPLKHAQGERKGKEGKGKEINNMCGSSEKSQKSELKKQALQVLEFFNSRTGSAYKASKTSLTPIESILSEGYSVQDCKTVIVSQWFAWKDSETMKEYIRIKTIFAKKNFLEYFNICEKRRLEIEAEERANGQHN